jgi:hypothetical protein
VRGPNIKVSDDRQLMAVSTSGPGLGRVKTRRNGVGLFQ